jgi:hypothetical protein
MIANSLSQYWNACTRVVARIPPLRTLITTIAATRDEPDHGGSPVMVARVSPATWNCGTMYSNPISTKNRVARWRSRAEPSRASAKSGRV